MDALVYIVGWMAVLAVTGFVLLLLGLMAWSFVGAVLATRRQRKMYDTLKMAGPSAEMPYKEGMRWQTITDPFRDFWNAQGEWSEKTFGPSHPSTRPAGYNGPLRGPAGPLKHILRELITEFFGLDRKWADDLIARIDDNKEKWNLDDPEEYADLQFLTTDATRRRGRTYDQMLDELWKKLAKNQARAWPPPSADNSESAVEHVRPGASVPRGRCWVCGNPATLRCPTCIKTFCQIHGYEHGGPSARKMLPISVDDGGEPG